MVILYYHVLISAHVLSYVLILAHVILFSINASCVLQPYFDEYEAEKSIYHEQLKVYHNSPSYKRWLEEKRLGLCSPTVCTYIIMLRLWYSH